MVLNDGDHLGPVATMSTLIFVLLLFIFYFSFFIHMEII